ncbi:MAG: hypothetical protein U1F36_04840 [Planctomycetota bacterium]
MVGLFWICFAATLLLLGLTLRTGFAGRRRPHVALALATVAMLTVTVLLTEALLRAVVFPEKEMGIHLVFAKSGALLVLPVALTGIATWKRRAFLRWHLIAVLLFLVAAVTATGTGIWVYSLSTPR